MAHIFELTIKARPRDSGEFTILLDFKEALFKEVFQNEIGHFPNSAAVDQALDPLTIIIPRKKHSDHFRAFLFKQAENYGVIDDLDITVHSN